MYHYTCTSLALPPIYTELAPKHTTTASVAQSVEHWSKDPYSRSQVQSPAGSLEVAYFACGPDYL